jgi:nicotinamide phosphoribosyltransferase
MTFVSSHDGYNPIMDADSYKASHFLQLPPEVRRVSSYVEARSLKQYRFVEFFGLQAYLMSRLSVPVTRDHIAEAREIIPAHGLPFNEAGWQRIVDVHGGYLPLRIEALPEGTIAPVGVPLVQVMNTDPELPWLPAYVETPLLRSVWYPSTVATRSRFIWMVIKAALEKTCDDDRIATVLPFRLHDFGARGGSSEETVAVGGAAHLINFMGTDTMGALRFVRRYYPGPDEAFMPGYSIPAAEHSTITSWGRTREIDAYRNMLDKFAKPGALVAVVSDSYDLMHAIDVIWGEQLKSEIEASGATVIIRPDSGNPKTVPVEAVERLGAKFGVTVNSKGYKVLPDCVRVIQGDGINELTIIAILASLKAKGWSAENIAFGMGGELLQTPNRDTLGFAMKTNAVQLDNGNWQDVYKQPKDDNGKSSKRGVQSVVDDFGRLKAVRRDSLLDGCANNLLQPVWENGAHLKMWSFSDVRANAQLKASELWSQHGVPAQD